MNSSLVEAKGVKIKISRIPRDQFVFSRLYFRATKFSKFRFSGSTVRLDCTAIQLSGTLHSPCACPHLAHPLPLLPSTRKQTLSRARCSTTSPCYSSVRNPWTTTCYAERFEDITGERLVVIAVAARALHACAAGFQLSTLIDACFRRRDQSCTSCRCALMLSFGTDSLRSVREGEDRYIMLFCDSAVHPTAVLISLIY